MVLSEAVQECVSKIPVGKVVIVRGARLDAVIDPADVAAWIRGKYGKTIDSRPSWCRAVMGLMMCLSKGNFVRVAAPGRYPCMVCDFGPGGGRTGCFMTRNLSF